MRFLYLIEWNFTGFSGVERKIGSQLSVWKHAGHDVKTVIIGKHVGIDQNLLNNPDLDFWYVPSATWLQHLFLDKLIKQLYFLIAYFKYLFSPFDFVYYRQSTLSLAPLFSIRRNLVIDVNSIDVEAKDGIKLLIEPISKLYRLILFKRAKAIFFITYELKKYYKEKYGLEENLCCVIGNGYANSQFSEEVMQSYYRFKVSKTRGKPCLLFVGSGGDEHYWHGYDKFINIVSYFPEYDFLLVGEVGNQFDQYTNLQVINRMDTKDMPDIFFKADIGVGTLALHRKNMNEASPLKVAEYVFWGLPVITAYVDINLQGKEFNLELPNIEDNITKATLEQIRIFVDRNANKILSDQERATISMYSIEAKRLANIGERI